MSLHLLTPELVLIIAGFLSRKKDLNSLARTSHYLYQWVNPRLYKHGVRTRANRLLYWATAEGQLETLKKALNTGAKLPAPYAPATDAHCDISDVEYYRENERDEEASRQMDIGHPISIAGADPARLGKTGCGPLESAAMCNSLEIFKYLLAQMQKLKGSATYQQQLGDALCSAVCAQTKKEVIELLLQSGARVNHIYRDEAQTALFNAVRIGDKKLVRLLLDHGADPMIEVQRWDSPILVCAAWRGHHAIVYMLVKNHPELERQVADAMFEAARWGQESMTNYFLAKGANPDHIRNGTRTALSHAGEAGHAGIAEVLLAAGADLTAPDANGRTPIWYAMQTRHKAVRVAFCQHSLSDVKPYLYMEPDETYVPEELPPAWEAR
ncbi:ankyrin [Aspergillus sclerotioniger CBS 115572]|uniref:Ankyrin n=1 Tax=Aspergillus sclerotioniger CBS 115572 TaxID=1450535 RepID=A0A317WVG2_9EURO|nr:ankyrin [Aspergillus sclerotioniger CBS 115572]PWY88838.1 ankyrin [Aspergillus sclerotioniger CBS 115572]